MMKYVVGRLVAVLPLLAGASAVDPVYGPFATEAGGIVIASKVSRDLSEYSWRASNGAVRCITVSMDESTDPSSPISRLMLEVTNYSPSPSVSLRISLTGNLSKYDPTREVVKTIPDAEVFKYPMAGQNGLYLIITVFEDFEGDRSKHEKVAFYFGDGAELTSCLSGRRNTRRLRNADTMLVNDEYEDFEREFAEREHRP